MLPKFIDYISRHDLVGKADRILLAVSGGLDSMVMLHLFKEAGYEVGVANGNFGLRGKESTSLITRSANSFVLFFSSSRVMEMNQESGF